MVQVHHCRRHLGESPCVRITVLSGPARRLEAQVDTEPTERDSETDGDDTGDDDDTETEAGGTGEDRTQSRAKRRKRRYDRMARIEGRVTENQLRRLDQLRGDLMKRRSRTGDRITNNTLLRVAVEGLLSCRRELHGNDEDELQASFLDYLERARERS